MCVNGISFSIVVYTGGDIFGNHSVCIKVGHYISHLPLSLIVGVHPPWSLLWNSIPAVI